ncbi:hypothetical protein FRB95_010510 [Tulasnella sp. JGI-2019a]|nr:hypothetical protein FRB95_010510 [Tulasnella sp. JGI-2019a]
MCFSDNPSGTTFNQLTVAKTAMRFATVTFLTVAKSLPISIDHSPDRIVLISFPSTSRSTRCLQNLPDFPTLRDLCHHIITDAITHDMIVTSSNKKTSSHLLLPLRLYRSPIYPSPRLIATELAMRFAIIAVITAFALFQSAAAAPVAELCCLLLEVVSTEHWLSSHFQDSGSYHTLVTYSTRL